MSKVILSLFIFLSLISSSFPAEQTVAPAKTVAEIAHQLCDQGPKPPAEANDFEETVVPETVRVLLPSFKKALRAFILEYLNRRSSSNLTPAQLRQRMLDELREAGVKIGWPAESAPYCGFGVISDILVHRVEHPPERLAVVVTLQIPCGSDSSLYIVHKRTQMWELVLRDEVETYEEISGGYDALGYKISPPDADGKWYVVTANTRPWCTSCWNRVLYRVLSPGGSPGSPRIVFQNSGGIYRCQDDLFRITAGRNNFQITYYSWFSMDPDLWMRAHVMAHRIKGDRIVRIAPLAFRPHDFVDEWLTLSWEEAGQWSSEQNKSELKRWHESIRRRTSEVTWWNIRSVQECPRGRRWVIKAEAYMPVAELPALLFFAVTQPGDVFQMQAISEKQPPGCPGETPPDNRFPEKLP